MLGFLFGNSLWQLVLQADLVSKGVLLFLLFLSITCWTLFFYKLILLRLKARQLKKVLLHMKEVKNLDQLVTTASVYTGQLPGYFLSRSLLTVKKQLELSSEDSPDWQSLNEQMNQSIDDILHHEESYLPFIATSANVSTLIGLFGTVWGLIHSFVRISEMQSADIATVAPGIAEALLTTLAGLLVAIPAFFMYNYLIVQVSRIEQQLLKLSDNISTIVRPALVQKVI